MPPKEQEMFDKEFVCRRCDNKHITNNLHPEKIKQYISKHYILREDLLGELEEMEKRDVYNEDFHWAVSDFKTFINKQE